MERHWSEKEREEMTERDWRIFREDYNISYKVVDTSEFRFGLPRALAAYSTERCGKEGSSMESLDILHSSGIFLLW